MESDSRVRKLRNRDEEKMDEKVEWELCWVKVDWEIDKRNRERKQNEKLEREIGERK